MTQHSIELDDGRVVRMLDTVAEQCEFVIEHETRGIFRGFDHAASSCAWGPRFLRSDRITRRSPEVWSTRDPTAALSMIGRVLDHVKDAYLVKLLRHSRGAR
jgi:hypothetical protein